MLVWVGSWSWPQGESWLDLIKHAGRDAGHVCSSASGCCLTVGGVMETTEPHVFDLPSGLFTWKVSSWRMREEAKMTSTFQFCLWLICCCPFGQNTTYGQAQVHYQKAWMQKRTLQQCLLKKIMTYILEKLKYSYMKWNSEPMFLSPFSHS